LATGFWAKAGAMIVRQRAAARKIFCMSLL
jgi:hypothetical protein